MTNFNQYDRGDLAWMLMSTALVFLMIPGLGYFYSGMAQSKNALSLIMLCCLSLTIVNVEWFCVGYSLVFSKSGGKFIGNFENSFLINVLDEPSVGSKAIPDIMFMIFQGMFAAITPALAIGAAAERGRMLPAAVFILLWSLLVYNFVACWTWSPNGWGAYLGVLDYAGGTPIHITSGMAALVFSFMVGRRKGHGQSQFTPHNMSNVILGTALLWFGWFGFNGGSALGANIRAIVSCVSTNVAASAGGLTWIVIEYLFIEPKVSAMAFCSGAVAGLVTITPGAGFVNIAASVLFGVLGSCVCCASLKFKQWMRCDDALDVFAIHGVGGMLGSILTGIFARKSIANLDPEIVIKGGWIDGNWIQVPIQLADCCAAAAWSGLMTFLILFVMDRIPGLRIRADDESEQIGMDLAELGSHAYAYTFPSPSSVLLASKTEKQLPIQEIDSFDLRSTTYNNNNDISENSIVVPQSATIPPSF